MSDPKPQTCRECGGTMMAGKGLLPTIIGGTPDFPCEDYPTTFSVGGPGELVDCLKCEKCGWSVTP